MVYPLYTPCMPLVFPLYLIRLYLACMSHVPGLRVALAGPAGAKRPRHFLSLENPGPSSGERNGCRRAWPVTMLQSGGVLAGSGRADAGSCGQQTAPAAAG